MKRKMKRLFRESEESYSDFAEKNEEHLPGRRQSEIPRRRWLIPCTIGLAAIVLVCCCVPIFRNRMPQYGEDDLRKFSCDEEFFEQYCEMEADSLQETIFFQGQIAATSELAMVEAQGIYWTSDCYAEINTAVVLIPNLTISKDLSVTKCKETFSVNGYEFRFAAEGKNEVYYHYLFYLEQGKLRYYVTLSMLEENRYREVVELLFLSQENTVTNASLS